ncbi:hypothetical protein [Variovorax paradoxus]|uniref:hypothetical protein n=1 Tax=Variovorax paradoxus TaxID=34073 RepID=UPI002783BBB8|nr:hypothetical protein [Variovorax paradoxus]MDP9932881.1 hypothetical protein [Variovorax paradoxus]
MASSALARVVIEPPRIACGRLVYSVQDRRFVIDTRKSILARTDAADDRGSHGRSYGKQRN